MTGGPGRSRDPSVRASMPSRGFFGQMASCLLTIRSRVSAIRRKQLLIIAAIFVVATITLQTEQQFFLKDLRAGTANLPAQATADSNEQVFFETTSNNANKTAFEAVSAVSVPTDNAENEAPSTKDKTEAEHTANHRESDYSQSKRRDNSSIRSSKNEEGMIPRSHDGNKNDSSSVEKKPELDKVDASGKKNAREAERSSNNQDLQTKATNSTDGSAGEDEDKVAVANHDRSDDTGDQTDVAETADNENNKKDRLGNTDGINTSDKSNSAEQETLKTSNSSASEVSSNKTDSTTIESEDLIRNLETNELVKDIGFARTKCFSASGEPRYHTCAPSVVVAGYEKCGTSALYYKLTKHPEIVAHSKWKEHCPSEDSLGGMWSWFERLPVLKDSTSKSLLLNGCIGIVSSPIILKELQRLNPNLKVLVALRNYADWSYSFYGYRCYSGYDEGCEHLEKPNSYGPWKETRNPENFDKLVKDIEKTGKSKYEAFGVLQPNVDLFRQWLVELVDIVGKKAVKIIKQEDLSFSPHETLSGVASFLEIDAALFPDEVYSLVSNTNDHPAEISFVNETATKNEISAVINSGDAIQNDTRSLLNKFWKSECEWLRDNFNVHFSDIC